MWFYLPDCIDQVLECLPVIWEQPEGGAETSVIIAETLQDVFEQEMLAGVCQRFPPLWQIRVKGIDKGGDFIEHGFGA